MNCELWTWTVQTVLAAGSYLLSDDHMTSWQDLTTSDQQTMVNELTTAVEMSSFMRADYSRTHETIVVDYNNIGMSQ